MSVNGTVQMETTCGGDREKGYNWVSPCIGPSGVGPFSPGRSSFPAQLSGGSSERGDQVADSSSTVQRIVVSDSPLGLAQASR